MSLKDELIQQRHQLNKSLDSLLDKGTLNAEDRALAVFLISKYEFVDKRIIEAGYRDILEEN